MEEYSTNKLATLLGILLVFVALSVAPIPLGIMLHNPTHTVVIYPNVLFAIPLILLGSLLLLYGLTAESSVSKRFSQ